MKTLEDFGIRIPEILLPSPKNQSSWPVIACDQYTQDKSYWENLTTIVSGRPSTLNLILPEIYLDDHKEERIEQIRETMKSYIKSDVFQPVKKCFVYVERSTPFGRLRKGLVALVDLEKYDWRPFSRTNIRATEATIVSRIPPRIAIRKGAPIELPHVMLLVDDKDRLLVERTGSLALSKPPLYEIELMCGGGSVKGWEVSTNEEVSSVLGALQNLGELKREEDGSIFLFAVGDGNHSLATAKAVWNEYKSELKSNSVNDIDINNSPVRWALVEIVNLYDDGLNFEPIHRVVFGADSGLLIEKLADQLKGQLAEFENDSDLVSAVKNSETSFGFVYFRNGEKKFTSLSIKTDGLAVSAFQPALDFVLDNFGGKQRPVVDYIHGADEVIRLGDQKDATGILLPPVSKNKFFDTIRKTGPLPKKSFSLGEADEKRFYLECRKLFPLYNDEVNV